jgi:hypothetical protein
MDKPKSASSFRAERGTPIKYGIRDVLSLMS